MITVAVDPGVHRCGVAIFKGALLTEAFLHVGSDDEVSVPDAVVSMERSWRAALERIWNSARRGTVLVVEKPQVYDRRRKGDQNDLVDLSLVVGAVIVGSASGCDHMVLYQPHDWKGSVKKEVMTDRIQGWVSKEEATRVPLLPRSLVHNVWDAVGLGIHHLATQGLRVKGPVR